MKALNFRGRAATRNSPSWSKKNFKRDPEKKAVEIPCEYCGEVTIPLAYHPMKRKIKFCSIEHGKLYMKKHPDTRYLSGKIR